MFCDVWGVHYGPRDTYHSNWDRNTLTQKIHPYGLGIMASVSGEKERPYPHPWHPFTWCIYAATQPFSGQDWLEASLSWEEEYYSAQQVHSKHPLWEALGDNDEDSQYLPSKKSEPKRLDLPCLCIVLSGLSEIRELPFSENESMVIVVRLAFIAA